MGAGRTELLETIFGLYPQLTSGTVKIEGKTVTIASPVDAVKAGLALVPEDRKRDGIVPGMDVKQTRTFWGIRSK